MHSTCRIAGEAYGMLPGASQALTSSGAVASVPARSSGELGRPYALIAPGVSSVSGTMGPAAASKAWVTSGAVPFTSRLRACSS